MKEKISKFINRKRVINLLAELVSIYSPYFEEDEIMDYVYNWLSGRNLPAEYHCFHEDKITDFRGKNVIGKLQGEKGGPTILLNGHLDTVKICQGWTKDPLAAAVEDNRMYGIGALDMKSGCAAIMLAVDAFNRTVAQFRGEILYTFVCDEEGPYGLGTDALLLDGITDNADVAVVPEPSSGFAGKEFPCLCLGARGGWKYTVSFRGKSAHAATPEAGVNAISEAAKVMLELEKSRPKKHDKLGSGALCTIEFKGGDAPLSVPDRASFSVFRHVTLGENREYLRREVQKAIRKADIRGEASMKFRDAPHPENGGFMPYIIKENNPYTGTVKNSIKSVTGREANIAYFASVGDFNYLATRAGLPTYVFGPQGDNYHSADEYVNLTSVVKTAEVIYDLLLQLLT